MPRPNKQDQKLKIKSKNDRSKRKNRTDPNVKMPKLFGNWNFGFGREIASSPSAPRNDKRERARNDTRGYRSCQKIPVLPRLTRLQGQIWSYITIQHLLQLVKHILKRWQRSNLLTKIFVPIPFDSGWVLREKIC